MGDPASRQEQVMREFAKLTSGVKQVFHPDLYGKNAKEPADLVIVSRRLVVLIYMKDSSLSFEKLVRRNLKQARTWIRRWSIGVRLQGRNDVSEFDLGWEDIDDIVVLSVLDGAEAACISHANEFWDIPKIAFAATITGYSLYYISYNNGGTRDLLSFLDGIAADGDKISPEAAIEMIDSIRNSALVPLTNYLTERGNIYTPGDVVEEYMNYINSSMKAGLNPQVDLNLDWNDTACIIYNAIKLIDNLAKKGEYGHLVLSAVFTKRKIAVVAAANFKVMADNQDIITTLSKLNLDLIINFIVVEDTIMSIIVGYGILDSTELHNLKCYRIK